jgi:hypothetical protein
LLKEDLKDIGMGKLMRLNSPEWYFMLIGSINSILHGASRPIFAILFGATVGVS